MKNQLADFYLDFVNNFLTIEKFAAYHGMSTSHTLALLNMGREMQEERREALRRSDANQNPAKESHA
jgi:hypothetical protein